MRKPVHIFSPGPQTSSQGVTYDFKPKVLKEIVRTYDPQIHQAPIRIGHEDNDKVPSWGWVEGLEINDSGELIANIDFTPQMDGFIKDKLYRKVSASFYQPNCKTNPTPGKWSLRHVAMLGGQPPAVKGLKDFAYSDMSNVEGVVDFIAGNSLGPEDDADEVQSEPSAVVKRAREKQKAKETEDAKKEALEIEIEGAKQAIEQIGEGAKKVQEEAAKEEKEASGEEKEAAKEDGYPPESGSEDPESEDSDNINSDSGDSGSEDSESDDSGSESGVDPLAGLDPFDADSDEEEEEKNEEKMSKKNEYGFSEKKSELINQLTGECGGLEFNEWLGLLSEEGKDQLVEAIKDGSLVDLRSSSDGNSVSQKNGFEASEGFSLAAKSFWEAVREKAYYGPSKAQFAEGKIPPLCKKPYLNLLNSVKDVQEFKEDLISVYPQMLAKLLDRYDAEKIEQDYSEKISALEEKNRQLELEKQAEIAAKNHGDVVTYVEGLFKSGKLTPAMIDSDVLVEYIEALDAVPCEFGEFTTASSEETGSTRLKQLLNSLPTTVEYKEVIQHDAPIPSVDADFHETALKLARENDLEYTEALKMIMYPEK